ncbi:MAG TPA: hypothetical protein PKE04_04800, partial [Clostridia bacterium]|nr:hypothetical protein [Clostridia bacterium]
DVLSHLGGLESPIEVDAPPCVEVFFNRIDPTHRMLQVLNLSGFNGTTFGKPVPVPGVSVTIQGAPPKSILRLMPDGEQAVAPNARIDVGMLERYQAYILEDA